MGAVEIKTMAYPGLSKPGVGGVFNVMSIKRTDDALSKPVKALGKG